MLCEPVTFSSYASLIYFKWINTGTHVYRFSECIFGSLMVGVN